MHGHIYMLLFHIFLYFHKGLFTELIEAISLKVNRVNGKVRLLVVPYIGQFTNSSIFYHLPSVLPHCCTDHNLLAIVFPLPRTVWHVEDAEKCLGCGKFSKQQLETNMEGMED